MADVQVEAEVEEGTDNAPAPTILKIPVTKAGKGVVIEVNLDEIHADSYLEALQLGLKALMNRGMTDIHTTSLSGSELKKAQDLAFEQGLKNFENIKSGKIRRSPGTTKGKVPAKVMQIAMQIAKGIVKDGLKRDNIRIADVPSSEITAAAKELIEENPSIVKEAEEELALREKRTSKITLKKGAVKVDTKRKAAREAKEAERKATRAKTPTRRKRGEAQLEA